MRTNKSDFEFKLWSRGLYKVIYTSPTTGQKYGSLVTDMELIDSTKNCDTPKQVHLNQLKRICKQYKEF